MTPGATSLQVDESGRINIQNKARRNGSLLVCISLIFRQQEDVSFLFKSVLVQVPVGLRTTTPLPHTLPAAFGNVNEGGATQERKQLTITMVSTKGLRT